MSLATYMRKKIDIIHVEVSVLLSVLLSVPKTLCHISAKKTSIRPGKKPLLHYCVVTALKNHCDGQSSRLRLQLNFPQKTAFLPTRDSLLMVIMSLGNSERKT